MRKTSAIYCSPTPLHRRRNYYYIVYYIEYVNAVRILNIAETHGALHWWCTLLRSAFAGLWKLYGMRLELCHLICDPEPIHSLTTCFTNRWCYTRFFGGNWIVCSISRAVARLNAVSKSFGVFKPYADGFCSVLCKIANTKTGRMNECIEKSWKSFRWNDSITDRSHHPISAEARGMTMYQQRTSFSLQKKLSRLAQIFARKRTSSHNCALRQLTSWKSINIWEKKIMWRI